MGSILDGLWHSEMQWKSRNYRSSEAGSFRAPQWIIATLVRASRWSSCPRMLRVYRMMRIRLILSNMENCKDFFCIPHWGILGQPQPGGQRWLNDMRKVRIYMWYCSLCDFHLISPHLLEACRETPDFKLFRYTGGGIVMKLCSEPKRGISTWNFQVCWRRHW